MADGLVRDEARKDVRRGFTRMFRVPEWLEFWQPRSFGCGPSDYKKENIGRRFVNINVQNLT